MKIIIVEDEFGAARNLEAILKEIDRGIQLLAILESVEDAVLWIQNHPLPDLGFFDIQLADGLSFEIFEKVQVNFPVVFTTAYDEYAIRAFKVNSIDYVLKPVNNANIRFAIEKYQKLKPPAEGINENTIAELLCRMQLGQAAKGRRTILIPYRDKFIPLDVNQIAYVYIETGIVYLVTHEGQKYTPEQTLDEFEVLLDGEQFFRINRQIILSRRAIKEISIYFSNRFKVLVQPNTSVEITVSKGRMAEFRKWIIN
jgi:DNA-binding LytR/AlgR family response regulator